MIEKTALLMTTITPSLPKLIGKMNGKLGAKKHFDSSSNTLLYIGKDINDYKSCFSEYAYNCLTAKNCLMAFYRLEKLANSCPKELPETIICDHNLLKEGDYSLIAHIRYNPLLSNIPLIIIGRDISAEDKNKLVKLDLLDFYDVAYETLHLQQRLSFLNNKKQDNEIWDYSEDYRLKFKTNLWKRAFDIVLSSLFLVILSPLMLLIALIIKLESKGPILYTSKRAGAAYKIFDFYKFRTMVPDADQKLIQLKKKNQYSSTTLDPEFYFVKIKNDPRITNFGRFLRNTSLDELPQFFNVLIGDMSIVGNRPLPLYEAEQLKRDRWAKRFLAPAGITGLWQLQKEVAKKCLHSKEFPLICSMQNKILFGQILKF